MDARLWNIGVKVKDVQAEADYFVALGGRLRVHERLTTPDGEFEYALVDFAGTRLFLTPETVFEERLPFPLREGLTHAVFEVNDLDEELAAATRFGHRGLGAADGDQRRDRFTTTCILSLSRRSDLRGDADTGVAGIEECAPTLRRASRAKSLPPVGLPQHWSRCAYYRPQAET